MPLSEGYTVEEQLTGAATHGGLQIVAYPMKRDRYESIVRERAYAPRVDYERRVSSIDMGLAPGGRMKQKIYDDPYGLDAWDQRHASRCFVTIVNSVQWLAMTGEQPPDSPPTAKTYTEAGMPWFDYYGGDAAALDGAEKFKTITSVAQLSMEQGETSMPDIETVDVTRVIDLGNVNPRKIREGDDGEFKFT